MKRSIVLIGVLFSLLIASEVLCKSYRRTIQPQHWLPLIQQEREPATPIARMGLIWYDTNDAVIFKDYQNVKQYLAGPVISYTNITNMAIDGNIIYVDAVNDSIGFFTNTPANESYIQLSDKFIICDTFTSAGIQACINALGSDGGEVYLPEGTYVLTEPIEIFYDNTTITGSGWGTILSVADNFQYPSDEIIEVSGGADPPYNVVLRNFKMDINKDHVALSDGAIDFYAYGKVIDCYFINGDDFGAVISLGINCEVRGCIFEDCDSYAINADFYIDNKSIITNNIIEDCEYGIGIEKNWVTVSNNLLRNITKDGIRNLGDNVTITDNILLNCDDNAIILIGSEYSIVSGNTIKNAHTSAISISGHRHIISGNNINGTDADGYDIYLTDDGIDHICIQNNMLTSVSTSESEVPDYGIYIEEASDSPMPDDNNNITISDNNIYCKDVAGIYAKEVNKLTITNNVIDTKSYTDYCIYVDVNCTDVTMFGNTCTDPNNTVLVSHNVSSREPLEIYGHVEFNGTTPTSGTLKQWTHQDDSIADDGTVNLPDATSGMVFVSIADPNNSFSVTSGFWAVSYDGVTSLISGSAGTTADTDSDGDLCVYDGGTYGIIKNRMGDVGELRAFYFYN